MPVLCPCLASAKALTCILQVRAVLPLVGVTGAAPSADSFVAAGPALPASIDTYSSILGHCNAP